MADPIESIRRSLSQKTMRVEDDPARVGDAESIKSIRRSLTQKRVRPEGHSARVRDANSIESIRRSLSQKTMRVEDDPARVGDADSIKSIRRSLTQKRVRPEGHSARVRDANSIESIRRSLSQKRVRPEDHPALVSDANHTVDVPPALGKDPSMKTGFENSPLDQSEVNIPDPNLTLGCGCMGNYEVPYVSLLRKVAAEVISTYFLVLTGCGAAVVDAKSNGAVTHVGVSLAFGIVVMIMIYAVGHISGAHMNPAVTLAFATVRHFPWKEVPFYITNQLVAGIAAGFTLRQLFGDYAHNGATLPAGTNGQSLGLEIIITFLLMFVVCAVATDTRAIGELAGIAVGSTVALNALFAGPISGASMNPARSVGPAVAANDYRAIWVYIVGPIVGAVFGAWGYRLIRGSHRTIMELGATKTVKSFNRRRLIDPIHSRFSS